MITSFILEWHNWSEHCAEDLARSRIAVYKNSSRISYDEFNGYNATIRSQEGYFPKCFGEHFFEILSEANVTLAKKQDYSVAVCDGSCWKMKIRHSNNSIQKFNGTIEYPPFGKRIEQELNKLCDEAGITDPILFGCCSLCKTAVQAFTSKWLRIFADVPPNADFLFEEELGKDCLALGFVMDCGASFDRAYSKDEPLNTIEALSEVIGSVDDVLLLGSAIFSNWRAITHWSYDSGFADRNKAWFLTALNRLAELVK